MTTEALVFDAPPWRLSGTVVAALLNHRPFWDSMGARAFEPPYKAPPKAPVLAVLPRHTQRFDGRPIAVPWNAPAGPAGILAGALDRPGTPGTGRVPSLGQTDSGIEIGVALGIVIGQVACRVPAEAAGSCVAGYLVMGELSLPAPEGVPAHYRPGARSRARDGFCPMGRVMVPASSIADPDALRARVAIDGEVVQQTDTGDRLRGVAELVSAVSAFMTLRPGDVLSLGRAHFAPRAHAGQRITLSIDGVGTIEYGLVPEERPSCPKSDPIETGHGRTDASRSGRAGSGARRDSSSAGEPT